MLLKGKRGIIFGIANSMSIAYGIAKMAFQEGAELLLTYQSSALEKRIRPISEELQSSIFLCDITQDSHVDALYKEVEKKWGKIDFLLHAVAYADKSCLNGLFYNVSREQFQHAMDVSCYSLISLTRRFIPLLSLSSSASILTLSYLGSEKVVANYNVMGVVKAALESSVRYLSVDVGMKGVRVNAISSGPLKTLAASGISDFRSMLSWNEKISPLKRNVTLEDVAKSGLYFLSPLSSGVTGEVHYVDCGSNIIAPAPCLSLKQ